jgi:nucleoid DNA-binding protein
MTKAELIENMAKDAGISKAAAGKALDLSVDGVNPNAA